MSKGKGERATLGKMKRQHPTDPNLFWCPKCLTYKMREEFSKNRANRYGINGVCCECRRTTRNKTGRRKILRAHPIYPNLAWCYYCKSYKTIPEIGRRKNGQLNSTCKECAIEKMRAWSKNNPDKIKKWIEENRDKLNARGREDYRKHREKRLKYSSEYQFIHPEVHKKASDKYRIVHKDEVNRKNLERVKQAYRKDPQKYLERHKARIAANPEKYRQLRKEKYNADPEKLKERHRQWGRDLADGYVAEKLKRQGIEVTPETIELKRQQITMKRTLKQFQKEVAANEPDREHGKGKQCKDEKNNEGGIST